MKLNLLYVACALVLSAVAVAPTATAHLDTTLPSTYCPGTVGQYIDCMGGNIGDFVINRTLMHQCLHLFANCTSLLDQ